MRIFGHDLNVLRDEAAEVHDALRGIPGVVDLRTELQVEVPFSQRQARPREGGPVRLKPGDIRRDAATIVAGEEVSDLHFGTTRSTT